MIQTIIFLRGLPASGKSTWAKQYCLENPNFIRINKDDLRILLGNQPFSYEFENVVLNIQRYIGTSILKFGKSIIVDDTNFSPKHHDFWKNFADNEGFEFVLKTFDTPVEECIDRDSKRPESVGKGVILNMYEKYLKT